MKQETINKLIVTADKARSHAYAPYSNFQVGAAVLTDNNTIITGVNVESGSFGLTCCAERVALFNAVSQGYKKFKALAVVTNDGSTPCGACRQVIYELCGNIPIIIAKAPESYYIQHMEELLPNAFKPHL